MDCNGSAFNEGDRVLVRFTDNGPLVIGFEKDPVPCTLFGFVFEPAKYDKGPSPKFAGIKTIYGEPFESDIGIINPPLGTTDGANNAWTAIPDSGQLDIQRGKTRNYGNKNWFNNEKIVLSWGGPPGRAHRMDQLDFGLSGFQGDWETQPYVFHDLKIILDLSQEAAAGSFDNVFGAALNEDAQGQKWLIVVASENQYYVASEGQDGQVFKAFRVTVDSALQPSGALQSMGDIMLETGMGYQSHFYFSADGTKAVCTIVGDLDDAENLHIDLIRYSVNGGFSKEEIWNRNQSVGSDNAGRTWVLKPYAPNSGSTIWNGSVNRTIQISEHQVPIYCDFIVNREVMAFERRPSEITTQVANYYRSNEPDYSNWNASGSLSRAYGRNFAVVTSDNKTLFEMPFKKYTSMSRSYTADTTGSTASYSASISRDERLGGIELAENLLAIDLRFDFCAASYGTRQFTRNASVQNSKDVYAIGSGSATSTPYTETVEIWQGGTQLKKIDTVTFQPLPFDFGFSFVINDALTTLGINANNFGTQDPAYPSLPLKIGSEYLLTAAAYKTGPHFMLSFAMNYNMGSGERELVSYHNVSGYGDPVFQIIERSEDSGYLLCSVGLV
jgi:hypothetical protein